MKQVYDLWYRHGTPPWVGGPRRELVQLVTDGTLNAGSAIDLGCGVGDNAVFLAQHGFIVTGVDFAPAAISRARAKARDAGVSVAFAVDDLTRLRKVDGPFDLLVDYGTLDDLDEPGRDAYVREVMKLTRPRSRFLLWCFECELAPWERAAAAVLPSAGSRSPRARPRRASGATSTSTRSPANNTSTAGPAAGRPIS